MNTQKSYKDAYRILAACMIFFSFSLSAAKSWAKIDKTSRPIPAWPLIYHKETDQRADTEVLWPIFHYEKEDSWSRFALRPLIFSTESDPQKDYRKTSFVWPLSTYKREGNARNFHIFPLYWHGDNPYNTYNVVFPIYWNLVGPGYSHKHFWPLYGASKTQDSVEHSSLYPFVRYKKNFATNEVNMDAFWPLINYRKNERSVSHRLLPLYLYQRDKEDSVGYFLTYFWKMNQDSRQKGFLPLWYHSQSDQHRTDLLFPLYFNKTAPGENIRFITPLYSKWDSLNSSVQMLLPLWYSSKGANHKSDLLLPFYYNHESPEKYRQFITPFYTKWGEGNSSGQALLPLWYSSNSPQHNTNLLFPLFYNKITPEGRTRFITPLYGQWDKADSSTKTLLPLWLSSRSSNKSTDLLFPLYYNKSTPKSRTRFITPLYSSWQTNNSLFRTLLPLYYDYQKEDYKFQMALPLLYRYHNGPLTFSSFFPLYYHSENTAKDSEFTYYFPLYGSYKRGDYFTRHLFLFPFYASVNDEANQFKSWDLLWPLFHYEQTPDSLAKRALPIYWRTKDGDRELTVGFPLYWHYKNAEVDSKHFLPLYGSHSRGDWYKKKYVLGPVYMKTSDKTKELTRQDILFPLASNIKEGENQKSWIFPFYYKKKSPNESVTLGSLALLPPYYLNKKDGNKQTFHIFPFYGESSEGDWYTKTSLLGALYTSTKDKRKDLSRQDALFSLFSKSREGDRHRSWLAPFYYHSEQPCQSKTMASLALLPPYYINLKSPNKSTFHVWPFYGEQTDGAYKEHSILWPLTNFGSDPETQTSKSWVLPFYYKHKDQGSDLALGSLALLPPYYINKKAPNQQTTHLWPFYGYKEDNSYREHNFLWPLAGFGSDPENDLEKSHVLLYSHNRKGNQETTSILPIWLHEKDGDKTFDLSLFLHMYEHDPKQYTKLSMLWLVPIVELSLFNLELRPQKTKHRLFPFYSYQSNQITEEKDFSFLWPLISHEKKGDTITNTGFLWQVVSYKQKNAENKDFRVLWRFIRKSKAPTSSTFEINPLFYSEKDEKKGTYWAILGGLIGAETTPLGEKNYRFLWVL